MGKRTGRPTGRPQSDKIFDMDINISTTKTDIGAYTIEHLETGKVYHGSTNNLYRRVNEHQTSLKNGKHRNDELQNIYNEGGTLKLNFKETKSHEEAIELEQKLMDKTPKEVMLNKTLNAKNTMAGLWQNSEIAEKFKEARKGNQNAKGTVHTIEYKEKAKQRMMGNRHLLGHKHSEESKLKMSEKRKGKKLSEEHVRNSTLGRIAGKVIIDGVEYESRSEAGRVLGISHKLVDRKCKSDSCPNWKFIPKEK